MLYFLVYNYQIWSVMLKLTRGLYRSIPPYFVSLTLAHPTTFRLFFVPFLSKLYSIFFANLRHIDMTVFSYIQAELNFHTH